MKIPEAAEILGIGRGDVRERIRRGELSAEKVHGHWVVEIPDIGQASPVESLRDRVRTIVNVIPEFTVRLDDKGQYLEIVTQDEDKLPAPRENVLGKNIADVLPGEIAEEALSLISRVIETGTAQAMEYTLSTPAGDLSFIAHIIRSEKPDEVVCFIRDITSHRGAELALLDREEELSAIYDNAPLMIVILDENLRITKTNAFTRDFAGSSGEELLGKRFDQILGCCQAHRPPDDLARPGPCETCGLRRIIQDTLQTGCSHHQEEVMVPIVDFDGETKRHFWISTTCITVGGQPRTMVSLLDVTLQRRYERRLEYLAKHDVLTGLYNRIRFEEELTRLDIGPSDPISIISLDVDGLKLINDTMGHDSGDQMLVLASKIINDCVRSRDVVARVGGDEFIVLLPGSNATTAESVARRINAALADHNEANPDIPLNISLGVATTRDSTGGLAETLIEADARMYHEKLNQGQGGGIIHTVMAVLAGKDYVAKGHADRLDKLSHLVGLEMGLSSYQMSNLSLLSQVHDLGKAGTPDSILNKPGRLSAEQWLTMSQHPRVGFRIASSSRDLAHIADLILQHHEHWDGSGYPLGIAGFDIPIECRILAVVDAYDAMTNDRPYRSAMTHEEAMDEIREGKGTQFDPEVVEIFVRVIGEI